MRCPKMNGAPRESLPRKTSPPAATLAEGLVHLARVWLQVDSGERPEAARRARSRLVVQVDPLSGWGRLPDGEVLPPASLSHDLGRTQRLPTQALRELVGTLDRHRCRFHGCTRYRALHAHHVRFWSQGGSNDLANLVLLCSRHHTLVHAQGFELRLHSDRRLTVTTADGVPVLPRPALPWRPAAEFDKHAPIRPGALPPTVTGDRLDLGYAVAVLLQQAA